MQNLKSEISKSQIGPVQFAISDFGFEISLRPISKISSLLGSDLLKYIVSLT